MAGWLQSFTWQLGDAARALGLLARAEDDATRAGRSALVRCARGFQSLLHSFGLRDPDTGERMCREVLTEASPDSYDRLVAITSLLVPLYLRGDWTGAVEIHDLWAGVLERAGSDHSLNQLVERAVLGVELGHDAISRYRAAYEANQADGTPTTRAEHLLVPLSRAVRAGDWNRAARIIATIRALSRRGIELGGPGMVAIYLYYRERLQSHDVDISTSEPYQPEQIIQTELNRAG